VAFVAEQLGKRKKRSKRGDDDSNQEREKGVDIRVKRGKKNQAIAGGEAR